MEFILRANQRSKVLADLDTSVMSEFEEQENCNANTTSKNITDANQSQGSTNVSKAYTNDNEDIPAIDASITPSDSSFRSPLRPVNNVPQSLIQETPVLTSPLKSKFAKLSEGYKNYEVDIKSTAKPKEAFIHGPVKRVSMGGDIPAAEFFAPKQHRTSSGEKHEKVIDDAHTNFNKAKSLFETPAFKNVSSHFESPYGLKRDQAFTSIRRYDDPNPTKKPAECEIVHGPTFSESKNYWKDRERENPSGTILDAANRLFMPRNQPAPKGGFLNALKTPYQPSCYFENGKPSSAMHEARKLVSFNDDVFEIENEEEHSEEASIKTAINASWTESFSVIPMVATESSFSTLTSNKGGAIGSSASFSVPSDSFDYQKSPELPPPPSQNQASPFSSSPLGRSLLDDINKDFTKIHTPRSRKTSTLEEDDDRDTSKPALVYSLSNYRKAESTPQRTVYESREVVQGVMSPTVKNGDDMVRLLSPEYIQKKLKDIEYAQTVVSDHIQQTEKALCVARQRSARKEEKTLISSHEVELLQKIATLHERRRANYLEIGRLSNSTDLCYVIPRAKIHFTKIAIDVQRNLQVANHHYAYLFAMIRYNDQVESTQPILINDIIARGIGSVEFNDSIEINNVSPDFSLSIEIYGLTLIRKEHSSEKRFNLKRIVSSPHHQPERNYPNESFARIGQIVIQRGDLAGHVLDLSPFETPLHGHIRLTTFCKITDPDDNQWSGFVSIYRMVDGKGAWEYCYSTISNSRMNFWRYPEDADTKPPILSLNLRDMADFSRPISDARLNFQNDFEVRMINPSENVVPMMLSAAEERDREQIIKVINRSFKYTNTWRSH